MGVYSMRRPLGFTPTRGRAGDNRDHTLAGALVVKGKNYLEIIFPS
jgi:hypothetical protein